MCMYVWGVFFFFRMRKYLYEIDLYLIIGSKPTKSAFTLPLALFAALASWLASLGKEDEQASTCRMDG